ncbi:MAG: type III secretion system translocon subunit SctE [Candidatus Endonucleobacter sp. (ex Gigantidas childressi)]|nr:type III secretion system translocon subunit SctE [Candidatus Endonucleobacter sp. (ex Gigantidas childressi)]
MSSIGQSGVNSVVNQDNIGHLPADNVVKDSVKRGYDEASSQSRRDIGQENKLQFQHRLDQPVASAAKGANLETFKKLSEKSGATSIKQEDLQNVSEKLSPEVKALEDNVKVILGIQKLETMTGKELDQSTKSELVELITTPLSSEAESADEAWESIWQSVDGQVKNVGDTKNVDGSLSVKLTDDQKAGLKQAEKVFNLTFGKDGFADATVRVNALTNGPKGLVDEIKSDYQKISSLILKGDQLWDTDMLTTMLSTLQGKMQDNRLVFDQETIKIGMAEKEMMSKKSIAKLKESVKKADEAANASFISKIFSYIALAVMAVVTVVMIASGVGAVAAGFMIAALVVSATMMVDQEMDGALITKPLTSALEGLGLSKEAAGYLAMAIVLVVMIVLAVASGGASSAGAAGITSKLGAKVAEVASKIGQIAGGAAEIASGAAQVATGVYSYESTTLTAESKDIQAFMLRLQQAIDDATESLQSALEELQTGHSRIAAIMSSNDDTKKQLSANIKAG